MDRRHRCERLCALIRCQQCPSADDDGEQIVGAGGEFVEMFPRKGKAADVAGSVQRFADTRRDPASRVKHLKAALEALSDASEKRQLLEDYSFEAFHLVHELLCVVDIGVVATASRSAIEVEFALWTLEQILCLLPDLVCQRWQYRAIEAALKKCLYPQNLTALRKIALRLFLLWYQTLGANGQADAELDAVFVALLPHFPLASGADAETVLLKYCESIGPRTSLPTNVPQHPPTPVRNLPLVLAAPSSQQQPTMAMKQRAQTLQSYLEKFFDYICRETPKLEWRSLKTEQHRRCLRFLIDRLKLLYIPPCFPHLAVDGVDLYRQAEDGVVQPPTVRPTLESNDPVVICRYWLIRWVAQYAYSHKTLTDSLGQGDPRLNQLNQFSTQFATPDKTASDSTRLPAGYDLVREVLFGSKENVNLVLSLLREGLLLPFQCSSVMTKVFRIVREWIFQEEVPVFMRQPSPENAQAVGVPIATQTLLHILTSYFSNPYLAAEQDRVQVSFQVSQRILGLLKDLANPQRTPLLNLPSDTWSAYLRCLLRVVERAVPPSPTETQSAFTLGVATSLFQAVLGAWVFVTAVRAVRVPESLWNDLLNVFSMRTAWSELIDEWGKVLDSVTRALALYFYGIDLLDPPLERSSEQTVKKMAGIAKRHLGDSPTVATPAEKADQYNFCQQKNSPLPSSAASTPSDERRSILMTTSSNKAHSKLTATNETNNRPANARDLPSNSTPPQMAPRSVLTRYAANGSALSSDMEHGAGDSGRGSGPASFQTVEVEDDGSLDSATFPGGLLSGSEHSASGAASDGAIGASPIFGSDRDSLTPSPRPSASIDDELDNEFDIEQDKTDDSSIDLTPRDVTGQSGSPTLFVDTWMLVWRRVLCILGDVNAIIDPMNHMKAMHAVTRTVDSLMKVRANQGVSVDAQTPVEPLQFVPPLLWIAPWLLSSAELPDTYVESKREAVAALCRIFLHHQLDVQPSRDLICQFLVVVRRCLSDADPLLANAVLAAVCPHMFFERVPGADALYASGLTACRTVINSPAGALNKSHAIQFAAILSTARLDSPLAKDAQTVLLSALSATHLSMNGVHLCVNGLCQIVLTEGLRTARDKSDGALDALLDLLATSTDDRIALMICENLCSLFDNFPFLPGADRVKVTGKLLAAYEPILERIETLDNDLSGQLLVDLVELGLSEAGGSHSVLPLLLKTVNRCSQRSVDASKKNVIATAQSVLAQLVQFYGQFPLPRFNVAQLNCVESAEDTKKKVASSAQSTNDVVDGRVFVGYGKEQSLWSVGVDAGELNLTTRSIAGKHCWSLGAVDETDPTSRLQQNGLNDWLIRAGGKLHSRRVERERSQSGIFGAIAEPLTELCEHIAQSSPECLPHAQFPDLRPEPFLPREADIKAAVHQSAAKNLNYEPPSSSVVPSSPAVTSWHQWRTLLADLEVTQWSKRNKIDRVFAEKAHLLRSLRHLDQLVVRDVHKFAVIYVADGQEDKTSILSNKIGSVQFEDFVARLGWTVDLKEHGGYSGGLPPDCQTPYYSTMRSEVIFHVSTRLPDDATKKLRHLGNDEVHIVWSEHSRDYRRTTIATKFCDVLIVVYPLASRLFRVSIDTTKPLVFGPLFDGALVDWASLPTLVRVTAMNASRAYRRLQPQWTAPSRHRAEVLDQTLAELRKPTLFSGLVSHLYCPDNSLLHHIIPTSA